MKEVLEKLKTLDKEKRDELLKKINQCSEQNEIVKIFKEYGLEISDNDVVAIWDFKNNKSLNNDELALVTGGAWGDCDYICTDCIRVPRIQ